MASERGGGCNHAVQLGVAVQRGELLTTPIVVAHEVSFSDRQPVPDLRIGQGEHSQAVPSSPAYSAAQLEW